MNGQPWRFIIVQNKETLRRLGALARTGRYIAQAPLAIVVGMEHSVFAVSDASRAIQSMILTAWAQGVGSNWVGFDNLKHVNPVRGIPEEIEILAILPFGYPDWRSDRSPATLWQDMIDFEGHSCGQAIRTMMSPLREQILA